MGIICDDGMILKIGGEQDLRPLKIIIYMLLLGWCFMGVAIIADVFMVAIEKITSKKRRKWIAQKKRFVTVLVWNPTVANLTLMAMGSSAPEILINILEVFRDKFFNGPAGKTPLGPSTIVGSAAFNLLVIIGVCVYVIPDGEGRAIKELPVYLLTAFFSIFAYLWMLLILAVNSPHAIEIWEGVMTFAFFPILVYTAWLWDIRSKSKDKRGRYGVFAAEMDIEELAELENEIRKEHSEPLTEEQVARFLQVMYSEPASRAKYRIAATRGLFGGRRVKARAGFLSEKVKGMKLVRSISSLRDTKKKVIPLEETKRSTIIAFAEKKKAVLENCGSVHMEVRRTGELDCSCAVDYRTRDGTAKAPNDYEEVSGTLTFEPFEMEKRIEVVIVDDQSYEENEEFYIDLSNPVITHSQDQSALCKLGDNSVSTVVIVDDDQPGVFSFPTEEVHVAVSGEDIEFPLVVTRKNGSTGLVTCSYQTEDGTACAGIDYEAKEGTLEFQHQEMEKTIMVKILARGRYDRSEHFRFVLCPPLTGGAKFDHECDGGPDSCILSIFIECEKVQKDRIDRLNNVLQANWEKAKVGHTNWRDQFVDALYVNGGLECEDEDGGPSMMDYAMHVIVFPWKLMFALTPPTDFFGGWCTFVVALGFIGLVTALISDLANLLGCVLELCNAITAITFVAVGTSLPDTFASKTAAMQDDTADASIVNVTGSNSVNVFLGLGLPWMIASIKWAISGPDAEWRARYGEDMDLSSDIRKNGAHIVKANGLGFSVGIFTITAVLCLIVLALRRHFFGVELGGPKAAKVATSLFMVGLWIFYIAMSSWKATSEDC